MTDEEKKTAMKMIERGYGYRIIASQLGLSVNTVKSFCHRQKVKGTDIPMTYVPYRDCLWCGELLAQLPHKKKKKFCSDKCRLAYWNDQPEELRKRTHHECVCEFCGKTFLKPKPQRFCSTACYAEYRKRGGNANDQTEESENTGDQDCQTRSACGSSAGLDQNRDCGGTEFQDLPQHCLCSQCSWFHNGRRSCQGDGKTDQTVPPGDREPEKQEEEVI